MDKMNQQEGRFVTSSNTANHFTIDDTDREFQYRWPVFIPLAREALAHSGIDLKSQLCYFMFCLRKLGQVSFWPFNSHLMLSFFHLSLHCFQNCTSLLCFLSLCVSTVPAAVAPNLLPFMVYFSLFLMQLVISLNFTWEFHSLIMTYILVNLSDYRFV